MPLSPDKVLPAPVREFKADPGRRLPGLELAPAPGQSPGPAVDPGAGLPGLPLRRRRGGAGAARVPRISSSMPTSTWPIPSRARCGARPCSFRTGSWPRTGAIITGWRPTTRTAIWGAGPRPSAMLWGWLPRTPRDLKAAAGDKVVSLTWSRVTPTEQRLAGTGTWRGISSIAAPGMGPGFKSGPSR